MARYDYRCVACGSVFEVEHGMGEHPKVTCPVCGGAAERVFSTSGIVFAGHGFYNTDQRHEGSTPASSATPAPDKTSKDASKGGASTQGEKTSGGSASSSSTTTASTE